MPHSQTTFAEQMLHLTERHEQQRFVQCHATDFSEADFQAIKEAADKYLRANLDRSRRLGHLLLALAHNGGSGLARALGIIVRANASGISGVGDFALAVRLYNKAAQLYAELGRPRDQARAQIGKIYCLSQLSRYQEIEEIESWAKAILEREQDWIGLSRLTSNLGIAYSRKGDEVKSLEMFNAARDYCLAAGEHQNSNLPNIEHNRAFALRNLGRFDASIEAIQHARALHLAAGSYTEAARAQQSLATTYFLLGRYNEALADLDQVRHTFLADGRTRDAVRVDLYISDCLLQLRRFSDVLIKCQQVRQQMTSQGVRHEVAQAMLNEAVAYAGLNQFEQAEDAVAQAKAIFIEEENKDGVAYTDLQQATLYQNRQNYKESIDLALHCVATFHQLEKPVETAYSHLIAARGLLALNKLSAASAQVTAALAIGEQSTIPALTYQCRHLLGTIANQQGDTAQALVSYDAAIDSLEHLRVTPYARIPRCLCRRQTNRL